MTEEQKKYAKKRNTLIYIAMALLVIFVALMCYIVVYAKVNKKEYVSPDTIVVNQMGEAKYAVNSVPSYVEVLESTDYIVKKGDEEIPLVLEENTLKVIDENDNLTDIIIKLNDTDINGKIKMVYQKGNESLILTTDGLLYRPLDNVLSLDNTMSVGQILSNIVVNSIVEVNLSKYVYVMSNDNKIISITDGLEYDGVINVLECKGGNLYIYEDYSIGLQKGMVFVNENNASIKLNMLYNNVLIDVNGNIYEIDFTNKTMSNSKLGVMTRISYNRGEDNVYTIGLETNTGNYNDKSDYYYTK